MGTLVGKLHEEGRAKAVEGRGLPCLRRKACKRKWSGCEKVCGGYAPDLRGRR